MTETPRKSLEEYLALQYPMQVIAAPEGGYVIVFPDLPGCLTQVETADEIGPMAEDARRSWMESVYEFGPDIPLPSYPEEYSGKFNLRIPRRLHRQLAEEAAREEVSLNQYVTFLLAQRDALHRVEQQVARFGAAVGELPSRTTYPIIGIPKKPHEGDDRVNEHAPAKPSKPQSRLIESPEESAKAVPDLFSKRQSRLKE